MSDLHLIVVSEVNSAELVATGARVSVRVAGRSFITGREAFKKAAEVADLVAALQQIGVEDSEIQLVGVSSEVESGLLTKSSAATYDLRVECRSLDMLGPVMAAIAAQKNAKLSAIAWDYPEIDQSKRDLLQKAVRAAKENAQSVAAALEVPLVGIHRLQYQMTGLDTELRLHDVSQYRMKARAANYESLERLNLAHTATLTIQLTAQFVVGMFGSNQLSSAS